MVPVALEASEVALAAESEAELAAASEVESEAVLADQELANNRLVGTSADSVAASAEDSGVLAKAVKVAAAQVVVVALAAASAAASAAALAAVLAAALEAELAAVKVVKTVKLVAQAQAF